MQLAMQFDPQTTEAVMIEACQRVGINPDDHSLIRLGENAIFRLNTKKAVVRVGRSLAASQKELAVSKWLMSNGFAGTEPLYPDSAIEVVRGLPVTFWKLIEESSRPPTAADLGHILKAFHHLPYPSDVILPEFALMPKVEGRLQALTDRYSADTIEYLRKMQRETDSRFSGLRSTLGYGPIHGDAHTGNLMRDRSDIVHLIDYGDVCIGPREWDVCVLAVGYRVGTIDHATYKEFADAYGFDALNWEGFSLVQAARELNMTTWLMQLTGQSAKVDTEITKRLDDLRSGTHRRWEPF